jgi:hypothetical protein
MDIPCCSGFLYKALAKVPHSRYQSADEMLGELSIAVEAGQSTNNYPSALVASHKVSESISFDKGSAMLCASSSEETVETKFERLEPSYQSERSFGALFKQLDEIVREMNAAIRKGEARLAD